MTPTRRQILAMAAAFALPLPAQAAETVAEAIAFLTNGAETSDEGIILDLPAHFENGNAVPITVSAPGAEAITLIPTDNPNPVIGTFTFGPLAATQEVSTRIRIARSQEVLAFARMPDGRILRASAFIEVTIGGCGA